MQTNDTAEHSAPVLTPAQRKELKALAHHRNPVVIIGEAGLTEAVLAEIARAIEVHELVKIRVLGDDRGLRQAAMQQICDTLGCAPVQMIGKLLVVYRPRPPEPAARPRGPYLPKKAAASGATSAPARRRTETTKPSPAPKAATGRPAARRTAGARTDQGGARGPAPRSGGRPSAASSGRARPQAKPGTRTGGPRERTKKR